MLSPKNEVQEAPKTGDRVTFSVTGGTPMTGAVVGSYWLTSGERVLIVEADPGGYENRWHVLESRASLSSGDR